MSKSVELQKYTNKLLRREDLTRSEARLCGHELLKSANEVQIAAFLSLLTAKGETVDELVGLVTALRENALQIEIGYPTLDIVGTGGDNSSTINISTASCLLSAACGIPILKHGNRAISSRSGAADVLEVLGYSINLTPDEIKEDLKKSNFAFCFAPNYHPLLAHVREVRKNLGFATVFNLLGPLLNPGGLAHMLIGVYDKTKLGLIAHTLCELGTERSIVFHGHGLDELSCLGDIEAFLVESSQVRQLIIKPHELGLELCTLSDLHGEDAVYNAHRITQTLNGVKTGLTDTLILNAAVALFMFGKISNIRDGVAMARKRLASGNILPHNHLYGIITRKQKPRLSYELQNKLEQVMEKMQENPAVIEPIFPNLKSFTQALAAKKPGAVISEIKRASPSAGKITQINDPARLASKYVSLGAAAISVLTDEGFEGTVDDLINVSQVLANTSVPILRKEFILYPEQVIESKVAGADAILLMVSVLGEKIPYFVNLAHACGLETLVEVHAPYELSIALSSGSDVIGVNQRDLRDFSLHPEIFDQLVGKLPQKVIKVAESGIRTSKDATSVFKLGYQAILVGEALSRLENPADFFNELYGANES